MSIELSEQEQLRRQSLAALRELGIDPYPAARYEVTATAREIADRLSTRPRATTRDVRIAGRIMTRRIMGSASFFELQDHTGRIQVYIRRDDICPEGDPDALQHGVQETARHRRLHRRRRLRVPSPIRASCRCTAASSRCSRSRSARCPSSRRRTARRSTPSPIPKSATASVTSIWSVNPQVREVFVKRAQDHRDHARVLQLERGYVEVETPILQPIPGGAAARPFITHHNALDIDLYLRIASELYLKKLIVGGFDGVYEFGKNFRNEGMDRTHNPEFTVMEIYVAYKDYLWMMEFTEQMLEQVAVAVNGTTEVTHRRQGRFRSRRRSAA